MRRFVFWIAGLPLAIVLIALSVANRSAVTFSLDPVSSGEPALAFSAPLYLLLFAAGFIGVVVGWLVAIGGQMAWRREAKRRKAEAEELRRNTAPAAPGGSPSRALTVKAA